MISIRTYAIIFSVIFLIFSCKKETKSTEVTTNPVIDSITNPTNRVILSSEINWQKLNPARGDQSPQAGTIWGDRNGTEATGFLAKFADGFSSPPHIHNVTYRAVVIEGLIHNDDPDAESMWMKPGSFWTQPQGESHITASKGESIALVEIDHGPYLVKPIDEAFDNGERPINIDVSNVVWQNMETSNLIDKTSNVEVSFLWQSEKANGYFVKFPKGYNAKIVSDGSVFHSVVIQGELQYILPQNGDKKTLDQGSYFGATAKAVHTLSTISDNEVILYIRTNGNFQIL